MRSKYSSDISKEQFNHILPLLEGFRKKTKPRSVDLYEIICAIIYVLKTGSQWRLLPLSQYGKQFIVISESGKKTSRCQVYWKVF